MLTSLQFRMTMVLIKTVFVTALYFLYKYFRIQKKSAYFVRKFIYQPS